MIKWLFIVECNMKFLFSALTLSLFSISLSHANIATVQQNLKEELSRYSSAIGTNHAIKRHL